MKISTVSTSGFISNFNPNDCGVDNLYIDISAYSDVTDEKKVSIELNILEGEFNLKKLEYESNTIRTMAVDLTIEEAEILGTFLLQSARSSKEYKSN